MKKKTKSRLNSSFPIAFTITILICILGAAGNSLGFYRNFTNTLSKQNELPIATIEFKYKTAQRKFLEKLVWDRLKQNSDLYNGDTIHTSTSAEATIKFNDGNIIELLESTMIQVWDDEKTGKKTADVSSGSVYVETYDDENNAGIVLQSTANGNLGVTIESGSSANINLEKEGYVQVVSGSVNITNAEGIVQTLNQGESVDITANEISVPKITVLSPAPNQKIIKHTTDNKKINFNWKLTDFPEDAELQLEVSKDKDFTTTYFSSIVNAVQDIEISFPQGNYYWRIKTVTNAVSNTPEMSVGSRFQIIQSLPPELITPVQDYEYKYRTRTPAVRLIWSESSRADSYRLLIANNSHLNNPIITQRLTTTSAIISTLDAGTYYWQVTPYFRINNEGFSAYSNVQSFTITKAGQLEPPTPLVPAENTIVNNEKSAKKTYFSWKLEDEAVFYDIEFSKSENFRKIENSFKTEDNFIVLSGNEYFPSGHWYWRVYQTDKEGNKSVASAVQSFYAMEGKPDQHTVEPSEGYGIAETLLPDTTFTWKKSLPDFYTSTLQISKDAAFNSLVYTAPATGYSLNGIQLPKGKYYWRLSSSSTADDFEMHTVGKSFTVLGNLEATVLEAPINRAVARETVPYEFKWKAVESADYYKITIYRKDNNKKVYEDTVYSNNAFVDMYNNRNFTDRIDYKVEIQAKSNAIPGVVSRRNGDISESYFNLVKLRPVEISLPRRNTQFDGVETALHKIRITWKTVDEVSEAQVVVYKVSPEGIIPVAKVPSDEQFAAGKKVAANTVFVENPDLRNGGKYEIVVKAKTIDGIDISNTGDKYKGEFSVTPVEPLPATRSLKTQPESFDAQYLSNRNAPRTITLNWDSVRTATDYIVTIKDSKNNILIQTTVSDKTKYEINWLELIQLQDSDKKRKELYKGNFTCTVEAIRRMDTDNDKVLDTILQPGHEAECSFITDIPVSKSASGKGAKNPYGK